jgi:hypothetical protein
MDQFSAAMLKSLLEGGDKGIIALLVLCICFLIYDRRNLIAALKAKEEKIDKIVEGYYNGHLSVTDALNALKLTLAEIKGKL